ncbi:MAG TPA: S-methyl-5-thioribose-1-phosphate isomerase [Candidatus Binatia bacterium]|nr:S-methyl-5-thioribose-1-phosphate isomerase [Candidatus Binatia bacterium]
MEHLEPVWWDGDAVGYVDQRSLPHALERRRAASADEVIEAIATLAVRGAPAIGVFGAYGVAVAALRAADEAALAAAIEGIRRARPTAVNLAWAVDRVRARTDRDYLAEARRIHAEQREIDRLIGEAAVPLFRRGATILTHCNTGPLATGGFGTALGAIVAAHAAGKDVRVFVDETRPLLQGARLTMFELRAAGVPATLIVDGAAAIAMQRRGVDAVIVGADRIARNGDTANKIGTYGLAIVAAHHGVPFFVAAPRSTFDFSLATGEGIPIEERHPSEVRVAEDDTVYNPAFDVTPGHLVTAFITEYGIVEPPYFDSIPELETRPDFLFARA